MEALPKRPKKAIFGHILRSRPKSRFRGALALASLTRFGSKFTSELKTTKRSGSSVFGFWPWLRAEIWEPKNGDFQVLRSQPIKS